MKKKSIILFFLVLVLGITSYYHYHIYNKDRIILLESCYSKNECIKTDPLSKTLYIPNILKSNIESISIILSAKDSDTITYDIQNNDIKEYKNGIVIPIKYLVADKKTTVTIDIKQKDGSITNTKTKIKVKIRNNSSIIFYKHNGIDIYPKDLSNFVVKKNNLDFINKLFYMHEEINIEKSTFTIGITFDTHGNIRSLLYKDKNINYNNENIDFIKKSNICDLIRETAKVKDNKILVVCSDKNDITINDKISIIDIKDEIFKIIDLKKSLQMSNVKAIDKDWMHANSIFYDNNDNSIIISARNLGIFKISLDGKLKWVLTSHNNTYSKYFKEYLLTATDLNGNVLSTDIQNGNYIDLNNNTFEWPLGQHCAKLIDKNHIVCFDNGFLNKEISKKHSRVVIYEVDDNKKTVKQLWQYGKELGQDFYSIAHGYIEILDENNLLTISPLITKNLKESKGSIKIINTNNNDILFDMDVKFKNSYKLKEEDYYDNIKFIKLFDVK